MEVIALSTYIHFTEEQKQRAGNVNLESFLRSRGERLISSGKDKRLASDHSTTIRGSEWYDHSACTGGHAISFIQRYYKLHYAETVTMLLGGGCEIVNPEYISLDRGSFELPPANKDMRRVFAYLGKQRGISGSVISAFAHERLIYEDAEYHNAVFVGMDENGVPRHAHKRSTNSTGKAFKQNVKGSDPRYSFNHIGKDGSLYVFEAPIDMLSYISLNEENWQTHSYVACCGLNILPVLEMLRRQPDTATVYLCLDNDEAGQTAAARMREELKKRGYTVEINMPVLKDWNDDLRARA